MKLPPLTRRACLGAMAAVSATLTACRSLSSVTREFDVHEFGAVGDGAALDTAAVQRAVDAATAAGGGRVVLRAEHRYLIGPVRLHSNVDFHLEGDAEILASDDPQHYANPVVQGGSDGPPAARPVVGLLYAKGTQNLTLSGTGTINGRSARFMESYDAVNEWWVPKRFRPRLVVLEDCSNLTIRDLKMVQAPSWTVHLVGCRKVLIDRIAIENQLDVPNCDGIDPDHCQDVEIRNCHIVCGDDAIVIKATAAFAAYGPSRNITVRDCVMQTQDSGLKIGTETTQDIHDILFERCQILAGCRGLCIQLRDQGNVFNVTFRDIQFTSRYFSAPWWGRGEAISFTALPRSPTTRLGSLHHISVQNVTGRAENSIRIDGHATSRIHDITFDHVDVTFDRWTAYPGGVYDNRPTTVMQPIENHATPGINIRHADGVTLRDCTVRWGNNRPDYFSHAVHAEDATGVQLERFTGEAAHPQRDQAVRLEPPRAA